MDTAAQAHSTQMTADATSAAERLFAGPGELRARCRALDWATTPLGVVEGWSPALRTLATVVLAAGVPSALFWGPDLALVYNDAYIPLMGALHPGVLGRPHFEVVPESRAAFEPLFARVRAGETVSLADVPTTFRRDAEEAPATTSFYTFSFAPVREGGDAPGPAVGIHAIVVETTAHVALRAAEARVRALATRQAFVLALTDALRPLADPVAIQGEAARLLGEKLGVDRALYTEQDGDTVVINRDWVRGVPSMAGRYPAAAWGGEFVATYLRGEPFVVGDVAADPRLDDTARTAFRAAGIAAFVGVGLMKGGQLVATFGAHSSTPRAWTAEEVDLVHETAERTWAAVERARAEQALRETRQRLEDALATVRMAYWQWDPESGRTVASPSMDQLFGLRPGERFESSAQGFALVHPEDRERHRARVEAAAARGEGWHAEFRVLRPHDGAVVWLEEVATVTRDPHTGLPRTTGIIWDITDRKRSEAATAHEQASRDRDVLRRQLLEAEEGERRRLARELHDEAGQHLTALGLGLQALSDVAPPGSEVDRRAAELRALANTLGRELHAVAVRLRPRALDDCGLEAALAAYAEEWSRQTGNAVDVHARPDPQRLPAVVEGALYRVVQEALTNVARHSGAARASVIVERHDGHVVAVVEDDGRGFDADGIVFPPGGLSGLGLLGIRERVALLGGTVDVESAPGSGATIFVRVPAHGPSGGAGVPTDRDRERSSRSDASDV